MAHKSRDWRLQRKRHCEKGCISGNNNGDCGEEGIRKVAFQGIGRFLYVTISLDHTNKNGRWQRGGIFRKAANQAILRLIYTTICVTEKATSLIVQITTPQVTFKATKPIDSVFSCYFSDFENFLLGFPWLP